MWLPSPLAAIAGGGTPTARARTIAAPGFPAEAGGAFSEGAVLGPVDDTKASSRTAKRRSRHAIRRMLLRIGINLGDVLIKADDFLGDGVIGLDPSPKLPLLGAECGATKCKPGRGRNPGG